MADLLQLIEHEIPEARRNILDSHANLSKVADYCEDNYIQAEDQNRRYALEETKNYTTQSLASVAYQINTLATNFLQLLDMQTHQLAEMESHINHLSETVMIHKEKVARREIGVLTTNKTATRPPGVKTPGIVFPDHPERPVKYVRKGIDYNALDSVGNGVKVQQQNPRKRESVASTGSHRSSVSAASLASAPTTKPPTPPTGTIGRSAGGRIYGQANIRPAAPPAPPSHYMSSQQLRQVAAPEPPSQYQQGMQYQPQRESVKSNSPYQKGMQYREPADAVPASPYQQGIQYQQTRRTSSSYAAPAHPAEAPPPPPPPMVGVALPMSSQSSPMSPPAPPPPPPIPQTNLDTYMQDMNEPPPPPPLSAGLQAGNMSPPLPPPPEDDFIPPPPPPTFGDQRSLDEDPPYGDQSWVPETYLEKCVAVYDYEKDKDDELELREDAIIYVVKKNEDGWWEGVMDGRTGLFPSNYVEPV